MKAIEWIKTNWIAVLITVIISSCCVYNGYIVVSTVQLSIENCDQKCILTTAEPTILATLLNLVGLGLVFGGIAFVLYYLRDGSYVRRV